MQKYFCTPIKILSLLFITLVSFPGCTEEKEETPLVHIDHTLMETLTLINMKNITHKVTLSPNKLTFHDIDQSTVIINIYNTLSPDTSYQLKALSKLQKKYPKNLFVVSLLIGDNINTASLQSFIKENQISHYISNDIENQIFTNILLKSLALDSHINLPLTVLYTNGTYAVHYSGAIPIEMISYDIQQSLKQ